MAGQYVPLVLLPRYTTFSGAATYTTIGMDVSEYDKAVVSFFLLSTGVAVNNIAGATITFEESTDQFTWTTCTGGPFTTPTLGTETQYQPVLTKRWFRISVTLNNANSSASVWCIGFLEQREA